MRAAVGESQSVSFGSQWQGQTVDGRFPLQEYLGGSASSAVFVTELNDREKTKAAIKLVAANTIKPDEQLGAWREAAKLSHPHLVRIYGSGRCWLSGNELLYVISQYAEENLGQVLPQRALSTEEAQGLLVPTLEALNYLHKRNLVHGHLSPANILALEDQLKLSTDGIQAAGAKRARRGADAYEAPEVESEGLSPATDVWSLGATLVHALTQRLPRKDKPADTDLAQPFADIVRHSLRPDPSLRWTVADISARLQGKVVADPAQPSRVATVTESLLKAASSQTAPTRTASEKPKLSAPSRNGAVAAPRRSMPAVALVAVVVVTLLVFGYFGLRRHPIQLNPGGAGQSSSSVASDSTASAASNASADSPGAVKNQALPNPSAGALHTIHGHIKIRVRTHVDASGNVIETKFISPGPSRYFARLSQEAAQQWKFTPRTQNGRAVPSDWTIMFEWTRDGIQAFPQQGNSGK